MSLSSTPRVNELPTLSSLTEGTPSGGGLSGIDVALYDQMEESVAVFLRDGTYLYLNAATERLFGKGRQEMLGRVLWDVFPEARQGPFEQAFLRLVQTGRAEEFEHHVAEHNRWFANRLFLSGDRIHVFCRDITAQKWIEIERSEYSAHTERLFEETRRAEQRAAFLARASELLASSLDHDEILQSLTRLSIPTLGDWCAVDVLTPEGRVRRVALDHIQPERIAQATAFHEKYPVSLDEPGGIGKVLRTGLPEFIPELTDAMIESIPDPVQRRDTRELGLRSCLIVPLNNRGRTLGALTLVYGDTLRRYTSEDLRLAQDLARRAATSLDNGLLYKQAQEAIRARDSFLSVASHELNTPLTSLNLNVQALQRALKRAAQGPLPLDTVDAKLQSVQRQVVRLSRLVRELLDVSRISEGKLHLECEDVDLVLLARELAPRFSDDLARAGCELRLEMPETVMGYWDRLRMEQVLQNLVSNAIKYGRGRPIEVRVEADARMARMAVRDEGIGIAPESQARLFQRFERLASERHYGGFGLGLWIVKQIVDAMGGHIHVESEPGRGSLFTVELPLRLQEGPAPSGA
ncbi:sensor histidine kinase [Hyalangium rubrum]|uniref:histidine kinase n=1 Tax=Hyalangium rubrum TaxID=3103134 RepID=A0ABU5GYN6_9BACT|nr:ATP-binding protein [Hyalangium sp. s54d21]MDY7225809.1 ATP-binding protein [Hyalangium sp. s54d21]